MPGVPMVPPLSPGAPCGYCCGGNIHVTWWFMVGWIVCGFLAWGFMLAQMHHDFVMAYGDPIRESYGFAAFVALFGPFGLLLSMFISNFGHHGWRLK